MKYRVIDWYEGRELLYKGENLEQAIQAGRERYEDTDDEAYVTFEKHVPSENGMVWEQFYPLIDDEDDE